MKNLSKVIAITAVAAMSFSCLSAYAASAQNKSGQMQTKQVNIRIEANAQMGALNKNMQNVPTQVNNKTSVAAPQNNAGKQQEKQIALKTPVKEQNENKMGVKEKSTKIEELKAELAAKLEVGEITQEEYDKAISELEIGKGKMSGIRGKGIRGEKPLNAEKPVADENTEKTEKTERPERTEKVEMTEEEKAAKIKELKADLAIKLEAGEITQEEYDEAVAAIDAGEYKLGRKGGRGGKFEKGEKPEKAKMTEEEKAAKVEELKSDLAAKLEAGEITQEEYYEAIAAIDAGEYKIGGKGARGMKHHKNEPENSEVTEETEVIEHDETVSEETDVL